MQQSVTIMDECDVDELIKSDNEEEEAHVSDHCKRRQQQLFHESITSILTRLQPGEGEEICMETLKRELMRLPKESNVVALVTLLQDIREEWIPPEAVLSIWQSLCAGGSCNQDNHLAISPSSSQRMTKQRAKSAANIPIVRTRLLESKRKQAECDLKLLQNRILLLQQEESKAWKKIVQTKDRAQEILDLRQANLKRQEEKQTLAVERDKYTRTVQKRQHSLKKESVIKKKHAAIQIISKKYQDVEQVKSESKRLKAEKERLQLLEVERAKEKREAVRKQEQLLKLKKHQEKQQQHQEITLRVMKKVIEEERRIKEHQRKVQEMEQAERELIQRLQGTQLIQREAYSVLEQALLRTDMKKRLDPLQR